MKTGKICVPSICILYSNKNHKPVKYIAIHIFYFQIGGGVASPSYYKSNPCKNHACILGNSKKYRGADRFLAEPRRCRRLDGVSVCVHCRNGGRYDVQQAAARSAFRAARSAAM